MYGTKFASVKHVISHAKYHSNEQKRLRKSFLDLIYFTKTVSLRNILVPLCESGISLG